MDATKSIAIDVIHTITETDFGDRHSWRMTGSGSAADDKASVMAAANKVVDALGASGIVAHVAVTVSRIPFPSEW